MEGWLWKKGGMFGNTYQKRYCVATGTDFIWYKDEGRSDRRGSEPLGNACVDVGTDPDRPHSFTLRTITKTLRLAVNSADELKKWVGTLRHAAGLDSPSVKSSRNPGGDKVELLYFDGKGRILLLMLICEVGNIPYEYRKVEMRSWHSLKPNTPFGTLPIMHHGGVIIGQSLAIARYLGRMAKMLGDTREDLAVSEQLLYEAEDILNAFARNNHMHNKSEAFDRFFNVELPKHLGFVEAFLHDDKFTPKLTIGEIALFSVFCIMADVEPDFLEKSTPTLTKFYRRIATLAPVASCLKSRAPPAFFTKGIATASSKKSIVRKLPPVNITYFNLKGRALVPMLLCELTELPYQFDPVTFDQWKDLKPKALLGTLPTLTDGSISIGQSVAISRYIVRRAEKSNVVTLGNSDADHAMSEQLIYTSQDIFESFAKCQFEQFRSQAYDKFFTEEWTSWLDKLNPLLKDGRFTETLSLGEVYLFGVLNIMMDLDRGIFSTSPILLKFYQKILALPKVSGFLKEKVQPTFFDRSPTDVEKKANQSNQGGSSPTTTTTQDNSTDTHNSTQPQSASKQQQQQPQESKLIPVAPSTPITPATTTYDESEEPSTTQSYQRSEQSTSSEPEQQQQPQQPTQQQQQAEEHHHHQQQQQAEEEEQPQHHDNPAPHEQREAAATVGTVEGGHIDHIEHIEEKQQQQEQDSTTTQQQRESDEEEHQEQQHHTEEHQEATTTQQHVDPQPEETTTTTTTHNQHPQNTPTAGLTSTTDDVQQDSNEGNDNPQQAQEQEETSNNITHSETKDETLDASEQTHAALT